MEEEFYYELNDTIQKDNLGSDYRNSNYKLFKVKLYDMFFTLI